MLKRLVFLTKQRHILPCQLVNQTKLDQHNKNPFTFATRTAEQWLSHSLIHSFIKKQELKV
jgi:hypothetical protein